MSILRKIGVVLAVIIFTISLFLSAVFWTFNNTIAKREVVKQWINDSGVYSSVVDRLIEEAEKAIDEEQFDAPEQVEKVSDNPFANTAVKTAVKRVFTPEVIQDIVETVIDGTYNWLEGDTSKLDFAISLIQQKRQLADELAIDARTQLNQLPVCNLTNIQSVDTSNPFDMPCQVAGETDAIIARFQDEFINNEDFLPESDITAATLTVDIDGTNKSLQDFLNEAEVPVWYQRSQNLVYAFMLLALVSAVGIVFLSHTKRKGVYKLSASLFVVSLMLTIFAIVTGFITTTIPEDGDAVQTTIVRPLADEVTQSFTRWNYTFAILYGILAIAGFVFVYLTRQKQAEPPTQLEKAEKPEETKSIENPDNQPSENEVNYTNTDNQ